MTWGDIASVYWKILMFVCGFAVYIWWNCYLFVVCSHFFTLIATPKRNSESQPGQNHLLRSIVVRKNPRLINLNGFYFKCVHIIHMLSNRFCLKLLLTACNPSNTICELCRSSCSAQNVTIFDEIFFLSPLLHHIRISNMQRNCTVCLIEASEP